MWYVCSLSRAGAGQFHTFVPYVCYCLPRHLRSAPRVSEICDTLRPILRAAL